MKENEKNQVKMEVYLKLMTSILEVRPEFIETIPKNGAIKILLLLAIEKDNNDLSEKLIEILIKKHGESFLDELEVAIEDPMSIISKKDE